MKHWVVGIICLFAVILNCGRVYGVIDTAAIDKVTKKEVLDQQDLAAIDSFVAAGVQEMLATEDFSTVGKLREEIVARAHSSQPSADIQYNPQFVAAAAKNLEKSLADAKKISDPNLQSRVTLNLMILLDNLNSHQLAPVALKMTADEDEAVRYWAVHAVTNPNIIEQLNTGKASGATAKAITDRLAERINGETSPYILLQMAQFGAAVPTAQELLMKVADGRMKKYQAWNPESFSLDETVLNLLAAQIAGQNKANAAWRFGQLFAYMVEFYTKGKGVLNTAQRDQLGAVLVQAEGRLLPKMLIPPSGIKLAIDKKDDQKLAAEYKDLFGDGTTAGKFSTTLNIQYPATGGAKQPCPLPLPEQPKTTK